MVRRLIGDTRLGFMRPCQWSSLSSVCQERFRFQLHLNGMNPKAQSFVEEVKNSPLLVWLFKQNHIATRFLNEPWVTFPCLWRLDDFQPNPGTRPEPSSFLGASPLRNGGVSALKHSAWLYDRSNPRVLVVIGDFQWFFVYYTVVSFLVVLNSMVSVLGWKDHPMVIFSDFEGIELDGGGTKTRWLMGQKVGTSPIGTAHFGVFIFILPNRGVLRDGPFLIYN